jgi:hypothetical protein
MRTTADATTKQPARPRSSRAIWLVEKLLRDRVCTEEDLARELVIEPQVLAEYRTGHVPMPVERQLCLALVLIERGSAYARLGHQLHAQVAAATHFESRHISANDTVGSRSR